jgi:hypothetical protein
MGVGRPHSVPLRFSVDRVVIDARGRNLGKSGKLDAYTCAELTECQTAGMVKITKYPTEEYRISLHERPVAIRVDVGTKAVR